MLRLNLLPWRERQRLSAVRRFKQALVGSLCLALCMVLLVDQLARQRLQQQAAVNAQRERVIAALDRQLEPLSEVRTALAQVHGQSQALAALRASQARLPAVLGELERALPEGVELTELTFDGAQMQIAGFAVSAGSVVAFMHGLEAGVRLREPALRHMKRKASGEHFRMIVRVSASPS